MAEEFVQEPLEFKVNVTAKAEETDEIVEEKQPLIVRDGDIFTRENGTIDMVVTTVSNMTSSGRFFTVRLFATTIEPFVLNETEFVDYVNVNNLKKLTTVADQMESLEFAFQFTEGDVFTKDGEFLMEILSSEVPFLNAIGEFKYMVGIKDRKGISYRDSNFIKSLILGQTDQYPADVFVRQNRSEEE
jgi:hypothetical protein